MRKRQSRELTARACELLNMHNNYEPQDYYVFYGNAVIDPSPGPAQVRVVQFSFSLLWPGAGDTWSVLSTTRGSLLGYVVLSFCLLLHTLSQCSDQVGKSELYKSCNTRSIQRFFTSTSPFCLSFNIYLYIASY